MSGDVHLIFRQTDSFYAYLLHQLLCLRRERESINKNYQLNIQHNNSQEIVVKPLSLLRVYWVKRIKWFESLGWINNKPRWNKSLGTLSYRLAWNMICKLSLIVTGTTFTVTLIIKCSTRPVADGHLKGKKLYPFLGLGFLFLCWVKSVHHPFDAVICCSSKNGQSHQHPHHLIPGEWAKKGVPRNVTQHLGPASLSAHWARRTNWVCWSRIQHRYK